MLSVVSKISTELVLDVGICADFLHMPTAEFPQYDFRDKCKKIRHIVAESPGCACPEDFVGSTSNLDFDI